MSQVPSLGPLVLPKAVWSSAQPLGCGRQAGQQSLALCFMAERRLGAAGPVPTGTMGRSQNLARSSQEKKEPVGALRLMKSQPAVRSPPTVNDGDG